MGLDSLMAVEFSTRLQEQLGEDFAIAPTMLFDYPTVTAITEFLLEAMTEISVAEIETPAAASPRAVSDEVVIIGMGCRFPGAPNVAAFWDNLRTGVDSVCRIPDDRWDVGAYYSPAPAPGKMVTL